MKWQQIIIHYITEWRKQCHVTNYVIPQMADLDLHIFWLQLTILKIGIFFYFSDVANGYDESFGSGGQQCEICYKVFPGKAKLRRHYLIHTGEKPFKCELCKQTFNQKPNLKRHMIMHISRFWSDSSLTQFTSALYYCYVLKVTCSLTQFTSALYYCYVLKVTAHWHNLHQRFTTAMYWKWHQP